ncbi:G1/S-specific cyclin-E1 [Sarcophilus harrisii]|uniref:Cyclin E1 n=1 Tax=Sarcophilus harrisii TaxID=9305 RepID=G3WUM2_SARHA|nr:G1/S-specific cyclin-E1 [Sarcophilus harrisii]XP_031810263.1 G1/S-specific cyclin-E1 [Sarcophilus harrisii]
MSRESSSEECHEKDEFAQDGKEDHVDEKEEPNSDELVNGKEEPSHDELMNGTQERSPDVLMNGTHEPSPDELFDGEEDPSIDELVYGDDPSFDEVIYEEEDPNPNELVCEEEGASLDELVCEEEGASLDELVCEEEDASLDELVCEEEDPHADDLICEEEDPIPDELMCDEEDAVEEEDASPEELICDEEYPNADELICEEEDPNSDDLICEEEDPHPDDLICEEEIPHPDEDDFICEEEDPNPIDLICEEEDPSFHELICGEQDPSLHELFDGRDEPRPNARENPSPDGREDPRPDGREDPNLDARQDPSAGELFDGQNDQSPSEHTERMGERSPDGKEDQWNGKEEENMKRVNESRKEQSGSSSTESSRSRKRKADVAVFLLDPDEVLAKRETIGRTAVRIPAFLRNPWSVILTPDKGWDEPSLPNSNMPTHNFSQHRATPLPLLGWANRDEVWKIMLSKEQVYLRDKNFMERHPSLQPRMRSILLDWMMEVSEVYKLHRETYYLAQDFFDRYMATQRNITKTLLQLIGITSLFIAAKLEEIYPPKLYQFAYVTDGACTEEEILTMELIIMKALKWRLSPMTLVSWLNVYMQVAYLNDLYEEVLMPQYPQQIFVQVAELLDVCILDMGCFDFTYGVLAASALYHFSSTEIMKKVSGFDWPEVEECVKWMVPFAMAVKEVGGARLKYFKGVPSEDMHNIQTHVNTINLLDKAYEKQAMLADERVSVPNGLLTPPPSDKKPSKEQE